MQKLKILIVENESPPLEDLLDLIGQYPQRFDIDSIQIAQSFLEAQRIILRGEIFDLSFLDKKLDQGKTCFDLITRETRSAFGIIVLNTIDQDVQKYFEESSTIGGFLVLRKPFGEVEFLELLRNLPLTTDQKANAILVPVGTTYTLIEVDRILYIEVNDNYSSIYFERNKDIRKIDYKKQLNAFMSILDPKLFHKISDKHIVNMKYVSHLKEGVINFIKEYEYNKASISIPIPKNRIQGFKERFLK